MDVIREFVLRGRMEILKADIAVPDIAAFTKQLENQNAFAQQQAKFLDELIAKQQAREQEAARADAADRQRRADAKKASDDRKAEADAEKKRQQEARDAAEALAKAEKAAADQAKKRSDAEREAWQSVAEEFAKAEKAKQEAIEATNKARDEANRREAEINSQLLKGGDALKQVGDGAFAFARGLTLIGLEGESLENVARSIASIQAKFDLFRGGVDIIKGGVESARAFTKALELSGSSVSIVASRLVGLVGFLGPGGLIAAGAIAATAAIAAAITLFSKESESFLERTERKLQELGDKAEREANRMRNGFDRAAAERETLGADERIASIVGDSDKLGKRRSLDDLNAAANDIIRGFGKTLVEAFPDAESTKQRVQARILENNAGFEAEIAKETQRQALGREFATEIKSRDQAANSGREVGIREAESDVVEKQREAERVREQLKQAEAQRAAEERAKAAERGSLSNADQAFVSRASSNIGGLRASELERLGKTAPANFGQDVKDELTRRGGGKVAERTDEVAELKTELAALTNALKASTEKRDSVVGEDTRLDAESKANADKIGAYLREVAQTIETLKNTQSANEARLREAL